MAHQFIWSDVAIATLIDMWRAGAPMQEIARKLHISRFAISGKAHRLQKQGALEKRANPAPKSAQKKKKPPQMSELQNAPVVRCAPTTPVFYRESACRWPVSNPGPGFRFCEAPVVPNRPYCAEHCARAYVPRSEVRKTPDQDVAAATAPLRRAFGG